MSDIGICKYCKHINKDIVEKPCLHCAANLGAFEFDLSEHDAKLRTDVINEFYKKMIEINLTSYFDRYISKEIDLEEFMIFAGKEIAAQIKEQNNG